jgi:hypothetical protein
VLHCNPYLAFARRDSNFVNFLNRAELPQAQVHRAAFPLSNSQQVQQRSFQWNSLHVEIAILNQLMVLDVPPGCSLSTLRLAVPVPVL